MSAAPDTADVSPAEPVFARAATLGDVAELVRLRAVMLTGVDGGAPPEPGRWRRNAESTLRAMLSRPDAPLAAFVIDQPTTHPAGRVGSRRARWV